MDAQPPTIMQQVASGVPFESHQVSHHILDDCILEDVAKHIWQEELVTKFQRPYMANWSKGFSTHMYHLKSDVK